MPVEFNDRVEEHCGPVEVEVEVCKMRRGVLSSISLQDGRRSRNMRENTLRCSWMIEI